MAYERFISAYLLFQATSMNLWQIIFLHDYLYCLGVGYCRYANQLCCSIYAHGLKLQIKNFLLSRTDSQGFSERQLLPRPNPQDRRVNLALVELVLGPKTKANKQRWECAEELLALDTGKWGLPYIVHHCKGRFCCPHGKAETKRKLFVSILASCIAYVFPNRPNWI